MQVTPGVEEDELWVVWMWAQIWVSLGSLPTSSIPRSRKGRTDSGPGLAGRPVCPSRILKAKVKQKSGYEPLIRATTSSLRIWITFGIWGVSWLSDTTKSKSTWLNNCLLPLLWCIIYEKKVKGGLNWVVFVVTCLAFIPFDFKATVVVGNKKRICYYRTMMTHFISFQNLTF